LDVVRPCNPVLDDCMEAGRGRNVRVGGANGQELHGATSFLTPQQLNDLVDFENSLTLASVVGTNERVIDAGTLTLKKVRFTLPKQKKSGKTVGRVKLLASGTFGGARATPDPAEGVTVSLGVPVNGRMVIVERQLAMHGSGKRTTGHAGELSLMIRRSHDGFAFVLKGKGGDLANLNAGDRDLTVAIEFGKTGDFATTQFVQNRVLTGKKNVLTLPKK